MTVPVRHELELRRRETAAIRRLCAVPEDLTVTQWADRYRMLPETSASPGPFRSEVVPYTRRWMDLGADPDVSMMALCWAAQTTKSTIIENILAYRICRMPCPMLLVRPKIDDAEGWAKERFVPMVLATPELRRRIRLGRGTESTLRYKRFGGGFLYVPSAQSAAELASRSAPVVFADEIDRMDPIEEGNPLEIVLKRQGSSDIGLYLATSTPDEADTTNIWPLLEDGTFELYHVPCPHCGAEQPLVWANLKWPRASPRSAEYQCAHCERMIPERAKPAMLTGGEWIPTNPEGRYPSSHLNALYSPFAKSSWGLLAEEWVRSQGKPADLQVFVNTRLAELWTETDSRLKFEDVFPPGRLEEQLKQGEVPDGVGVVTASVDVQDNRLEVQSWGWGFGLESWLIDWVTLPGDTSKDPMVPGSVWVDLDRLLMQSLPHEHGATVPLSATFIDSGHRTTEVYRYCHTRRRRLHRTFACKGEGGDRPLLGKPTAQGAERYVLYPVGTDKGKNEFVRSQLIQTSTGAGFVHLPAWLSVEQQQQFLAEKRKRVLQRGKVGYTWVKVNNDAPNEGLDLRVYARAALESLGSVAIANLGKAAEVLAKPVDQTHPPTRPAVSPGRRIISRGLE